MRILSGIQPSGALHLGNFCGITKPAIGLFAAPGWIIAVALEQLHPALPPIRLFT